VVIDEPHEAGSGRSSSAPKKVDAASRIANRRRSSAFSLRSRLISDRSSDVMPMRVPSSISSRRIHLRKVSAVPMPISAATASIAAHWDGWSSADSNTRRTATARSSAG
jgi:hypothetical protein